MMKRIHMNHMDTINIIYGSCCQYVEFCATHYLHVCLKCFTKGILPFSALMFLLITFFPDLK